MTGIPVLHDARSRIFVALDMPTAVEARALIAMLGDSVGAYKIGLELLFGGGLDLARELKATGHHVFLDMKLLDIGATVEKAAANIARLELGYLTVHGVDRKTLDAAVKGRAASKLKLLAVTVLTNLDAADLAQQGVTAMSPADLAVHRARMAKDAGFDGVIASGQEAASIRAAVGAEFLIVTPGIRPAGAKTDDQARVTTPLQAIRSGATHLVVGRPITAAVDPRAAAQNIIAEINSALKS